MKVERRWPAAFLVGTGVGSLGGLIGLGGAEFRNEPDYFRIATGRRS